MQTAEDDNDCYTAICLQVTKLVELNIYFNVSIAYPLLMLTNGSACFLKARTDPKFGTIQEKMEVNPKRVCISAVQQL